MYMSEYYPIFFVYFSFDEHLGSFLTLAAVHNAIMNMGIYIYVFKILILLPLDIYLKVGLLGHGVVLFLMSCGTSILLSIVTAPIYVPPVVYKGSLFSTPLLASVISSF